MRLWIWFPWWPTLCWRNTISLWASWSWSIQAWSQLTQGERSSACIYETASSPINWTRSTSRTICENVNKSIDIITVVYRGMWRLSERGFIPINIFYNSSKYWTTKHHFQHGERERYYFRRSGYSCEFYSRVTIIYNNIIFKCDVFDTAYYGLWIIMQKYGSRENWLIVLADRVAKKSCYLHFISNICLYYKS